MTRPDADADADDGPRGRRTSKGERTKAAIAEAALALFQEHGYEATTMRAVAERAGVAVGNAYYYFRSKEHLIQAFYERTHVEHLAAFEPALETQTSFSELLTHLLVTKIETAEPYHRFSGQLFKTAADPRSPLNPFSEESREVREQATELLARLIDASDLKVPGDLADELPNLLWLYEMSVIMFWVHDESRDRVRTRRLIDRTVELVATLLSLSRLPLMGSLRRKVPELLAELRLPEDPVAGEDPAADQDHPPSPGTD
jgi:AcrR family transcriptional regulator